MTTPLFHDSTPAPNLDGTYPIPWRVGDPRVAVALAVSLGFPDAYCDPLDEDSRGHVRLWLGLRDNRDAPTHAERLTALVDCLRAEGFDIQPAQKPSGRVVALYIVDNEPSNVTGEAAQGRCERAHWRRVARELSRMADAVADMEPDDDSTF